MKKIILSIIAISLASLVFVLSGCELSFNADADSTQSHTAIIEITDESGNIIATESITISDDELKEGENFYEQVNTSTTAPRGVSADRIQQGLNNGGNPIVTTTKANDSKDKTDKNDGTTSESEELPAVLDDSQILNSTQYMIIGREESDSSVVPFKLARSGEKMAMYTEYNGNQIGMIFLEDKVYILSANDKMYLEVTKEFLKENTDDEEMLAMFSGSAFDSDAKIVKTMNQAEDGVVYDVYVYETGAKSYYLGGTIIKTVSADGGVIYYDRVSAVVPSSVFAPPADYTRKTLDEENVSDFAGIVDTTKA
ncbi:MAG: hypothetical protein E7530_07185 [Ruminococcaceae bacterium]|nr:hypothetical protein [Oscillospiraceae bacterium]